MASASILVSHVDAAEAIADIAVDAKDPLDIHVPFNRRDDRTELNAAMLGDGRNPRRKAARQPYQNIFDRRRAFVLGRKHLGVIGIELERGLAALLFAEAEEALDRRVAMGAVSPLASRAPLELRGLRSIRERLAGAAINAATFTPLFTAIFVSAIAISITIPGE